MTADTHDVLFVCDPSTRLFHVTLSARARGADADALPLTIKFENPSGPSSPDYALVKQIFGPHARINDLGYSLLLRIALESFDIDGVQPVSRDVLGDLVLWTDKLNAKSLKPSSCNTHFSNFCAKNRLLSEYRRGIYLLNANLSVGIVADESGRALSADEWRALCEWLGVNPEKFVYERPLAQPRPAAPLLATPANHQAAGRSNGPAVLVDQCPHLPRCTAIGLVGVEHRGDPGRVHAADLYEQAEKEILIYATTGHASIVLNLPTLWRKLGQGVKVKVAIVDPDAAEITSTYTSIVAEDAKRRVKAVIRHITEQGLLKEHNKFELRFLREAVPFSAIMVDGDVEAVRGSPADEKGIIRMEPLSLYSERTEDSLFFTFKKVDGLAGGFSYYARDIRMRWRDARRTKLRKATASGRKPQSAPTKTTRKAVRPVKKKPSRSPVPPRPRRR